MLLQTPPLSMFFQAETDRRQQRRQQVLQAVDPQAFTDTAQAINDPHNEEGRLLSEGRIKIQQLAESGFADTIFSIAGQPEEIRPTPRSKSAVGIGGTFSSTFDVATISPSLSQEERRRVLTHELGHRLFNHAVRKTLPEDDPLRQALRELSVPINVPEDLVEQITGQPARKFNEARADGEFPELKSKFDERFAQIFEAGVDALRQFSDTGDVLRAGSRSEAMSQAAEEAVERLQSFVSGETADDPKRVEAMMTFLLDQPIFENHPLNMARQFTGQAVRDVTRVRGVE